MQVGPYIADRLMPGIVKDYAERTNITFQGFSDEWVLRLSKGDLLRWIVGYKFDLNQSAAGELAQDKVATYTALQAAGVAAIPHYLVRSLPHELIHIKGLHEVLKDQRVVAKPLEGTGGRDVELFDSADAALAMIRGSGEPAWALSPHYDIQAEYRLIMLDEACLLTYEKTQPTMRSELRIFNLGFGAVAADLEDEELRGELLAIAKRVMRATGLRLAAVDIAKLPDGSLYVLEVNDGISMEHYARQSDAYKTRAIQTYEAILAAMLA
jgi:glutathione synthase/RimK-type ligase-like ATP-grasp enzyme